MFLTHTVRQKSVTCYAHGVNMHDCYIVMELVDKTSAVAVAVVPYTLIKLYYL